MTVKRIILFLATNIAVLAVLSVSLRLLGVDQYMASTGQDMRGLLIFSAILGFAGALISLAMSKFIAKRSTGARVITEPANAEEAWLLATVRRQATQAGIGMPEVAIYDAPDVNAFATGARRDSALVAVSTGLLRKMKQNEIEAVLAHEITHVANGDMVTLTLIQGVVNTFVIFLSRIIGRFVDQVIFRSERGHGPGFFITVMVAQLVLGILASVIVAWFSRQREFRADAGGAKLSGRQNMVAALESLQRAHEPPVLPDGMQALGISGAKTRFGRLFMTHPPLPERIAALRAGQ
ncbi:MAG: protease HtpX [Gammaproteobacteria bacterium]|nr:protease HtpX [Gammaproteobacteria bacterium]